MTFTEFRLQTVPGTVYKQRTPDIKLDISIYVLIQVAFSFTLRRDFSSICFFYTYILKKQYQFHQEPSYNKRKVKRLKVKLDQNVLIK